MQFVVCLTELAGVTSYTGGVGRRYAATLPELVRLGHKITVVLVADSPLLERPAQIEGLRLITSELLTKIPWRLRTVPRALIFGFILHAVKARKIYAPEWLGTAVFAPRGSKIVTNLVASLSLISNIAGKEVTNKRARFKTMLDRVQIWCEDRQIRRSKEVVACSGAILNWNHARYGQEFPPGSVVANCINVQRTRMIAQSAAVPPSWPKTNGPVVVFAGRVQLIKGIDVALEAFRGVNAENPDVHFVVAGGEGDLTIDPSLDQLRRNVDADLREKTTFLGQLDESSLYACMREAAVVVCPSRWEAFGNIALEVRASGGVLVATTGSGFAASCEHEVDSLLVPPSDPEALGQAILRVINDDNLRRRLLLHGQSRVDDFTASSTANTLSQQLEKSWN